MVKLFRMYSNLCVITIHLRYRQTDRRHAIALPHFAPVQVQVQVKNLVVSPLL